MGMKIITIFLGRVDSPNIDQKEFKKLSREH